MMDSDSFIPPNQIKINSGTKEIYDSDTLYDLSAAGTTVELFWENTEIINCASMFYNCAHIKAIDFSNFDTSEVTTTAQMFDGCSNLESLNLEKFDTSKVTDMWSMFSACTSLTSLNLFNFHISAETDIEDIFATCNSLLYINFGNAVIKNEGIMTELEKLSQDLNIIINDDLLTFFKTMKETFTFSYSISQQNQQTEKIETNIEISAFSTSFKEFSIVSPGSSYPNQLTEQISKDKEISVFSTSIKDIIIVSSGISHQNHLSEEVSTDKDILAISTSVKNPFTASNSQSEKSFLPEIQKNDKTIIFSTNIKDSSFASYAQSQQKQQSEGIISFTSLKEESTSYINTNTYKSEDNSVSYSLNHVNTTEIIYLNNSESHPINTDLKELNISVVKDKNVLIKNIREDIINGKYNLNNNSNFYYEFKEDNVIIEITNIEKEKNKEKNKNNKTSINLGDCEHILKKEYNISSNSFLFIFKIDIIPEGYKIPIIEYEIYYPFNEINLTLLNLSFCQNQKVEMSIPIQIKDNIEKYNSSSDYYNDICPTTTSDFDTDISIKDRRDEFIDNNMTLCEENCKLISYNNKTQKAKCSCDIKITFPFLFDDITINKHDLYKSFTDIKNIVNLHLMKCHKTVLKIESLKNNYGSYIIFFIIIFYFFCFILFYAKYYFLLKTQIDKVINDISNSPMNVNVNQILPGNNINNINNALNEIKLNSKNKNRSGKIIKKNSKKKKQKKRKKLNPGKTKKELKLDKNKGVKNNTEEKILFNKENINSNNIPYTDLELNTLSYEKALKADKRTYIQYYISLLRTNHLFLLFFLEMTIILK